jgi:hypothetical protein
LLEFWTDLMPADSCLASAGCSLLFKDMADDSKKPSRWQERKAQRASMYATTTENAAILQARRKKRGGRQYASLLLRSAHFLFTQHWISLIIPPVLLFLFCFFRAQRARCIPD